jgi:hypothetical protein
MAETPIVSETLQKEFRDNFPSQISSGRDLHVSDTIIPIVDFSSTAGVTGGLSVELQEAFDHSITSFDVNNTTTTIINTPGFWKIIYNAVYNYAFNDSFTSSGIIISDGTTDKFITKFNNNGTGFVATSGIVLTYSTQYLTVYLRSGDSVKIDANQATNVQGSARQIADVSGTLVNPNGYSGS